VFVTTVVVHHVDNRTALRTGTRDVFFREVYDPFVDAGVVEEVQTWEEDCRVYLGVVADWTEAATVRGVEVGVYAVFEGQADGLSFCVLVCFGAGLGFDSVLEFDGLWVLEVATAFVWVGEVSVDGWMSRFGGPVGWHWCSVEWVGR
jgi:hypothetical protein